MVTVKIHYDATAPFDIVPKEQWPEIVVGKLLRIRQAVESDVKVALEYADDIKLHEAWKTTSYKSFEEALASAGCNLTPETLEVYRKGLALLKKRGRKGKVSGTQAAAIATDETNASTGQGQRTDTSTNCRSQDERAKRNGVGIVTQRKLDRLARDYPKLHAKVSSGELSCNAAWIEAGLGHPTFTVVADDIDSAVRTLRKHYTWRKIEAAIQRNKKGNQ